MSRYNLLPDSDKELLMLAAKAAGLRIVKWGESDYYSHRYDEIAYVCPAERDKTWGDEWQPLGDDGDALRLAVSLNLMIEPQPSEQRIVVWDYTDDERRTYEYWGDMATAVELDSYAATRRAIVRAAAEIGKAMP